MPKTPALTPRKLVTFLKHNGFQEDHVTGSHYVFYNAITKKRAVVPYHAKDISKGTLLAILKQAGLSKDDLKSG